MQTGSPPRIAFFGAGSIAERHVDALRRTGACEVALLVSRSAERARAFAERKAIPRWTNQPAEALNDDAVDAVVVAYPTFLHAALTRDALLAGKHVIVEKPIAESVADAESMAHAALAANRQLLVCQLRRFWPTYAAVKRFIVDGGAGAVQRLTADFQADWSWVDRGWRIERPGGYLLDMHVHEVDLLSWWAGRSPVAVVAVGENRAEREATALFTFPSRGDGRGAFGQLSFCGRVTGKPYPAGSTTHFQIICAAGRAEVAVEGGSIRLTTVVHGETCLTERPIAEEMRTGWDAMWQAFGATLAGRQPAPLTPEEATASLASSLAAIDALSTARPVPLPGPIVPYAR